MDVDDTDLIPRTRPPRTREERWLHSWAVVVALLVAVELFFDGFPDSPDGVSWFDGRRPLIVVAACVFGLLALAGVQAWWGRSSGRENSSARLWGCGRYPAWFAYVAFGLGIVGLTLYLYAAFRSLNEGGSLHVVGRRAAVMLLIGSSIFGQLISWLLRQEPEDG